MKVIVEGDGRPDNICYCGYPIHLCVGTHPNCPPKGIRLWLIL